MVPLGNSMVSSLESEYHLCRLNIASPRGSVGPDRMFGSGALYHPVVYAAVVGIILPVPFWLLGRRYPRKIWRMIHFGVLLNSLLSIPPSSGINYVSCLTVGFIFRESIPVDDDPNLTASLEYLIRRRAPGWWSRVSCAARCRGTLAHVAQFNYTLSAALDLGTLLCVLFIFLTLGLPNVSLPWWGESVAHRRMSSRLMCSALQATTSTKKHTIGPASRISMFPLKDLGLISVSMSRRRCFRSTHLSSRLCREMKEIGYQWRDTPSSMLCCRSR